MLDIPVAHTTVTPMIIKRSEPMANTYTAVTKEDGPWWIGWIEEVPGVNCQERTRSELIESLKTALKETLEFRNQLAAKICKDLGIPPKR
jgi:predicted RNase H-like HicB family nuclease